MDRVRICPKCGCKNVLPPNPCDPTPCRSCGVQIYPELDPRKRSSYEEVRTPIDEFENSFPQASGLYGQTETLEHVTEVEVK